MLIIAGHLTVAPEDRDELVRAFAALVRRSRGAPGCLDAAVTADSVDPAHRVALALRLIAGQR